MVVQLEFLRVAEVQISQDVNRGRWNGRQKPFEQCHRIPLAVDDPQRDERAVQFLHRAVQDVAVPRDPGVVARGGVDDEGVIGMRFAQIDERDPAVGVVESNRSRHDPRFLFVAPPDIGIGGVGFDQ